MMGIHHKPFNERGNGRGRTAAQLTTLLATFALSPLAAAVANSEAQATTLEEVTVTAQKREQRIIDVPVSVNLVGDALLDGEHVTTMSSLANVAPSLNFNNDNIGIRGMGSVGFSVQVEPTVAFAVDGVVMTRSAQAFFDLADVERVEVLRGPQGTLFGKNASAGLINLVTKAPEDNVGASAEVQFTEGGDTLSKASVTGPLSDKVQARFSVTQRDSDGFIENGISGERVNGQSSTSARAKITAQLSDSVDLNVSAYSLERDVDGFELQWREVNDPGLAAVLGAYGVTPGERNRESSAGGFDRELREEQGGQVTLNWSMASGHTLTSVTAGSQWQLDKTDDVDEQPIALREPLYLSPFPSATGALGPMNFHQTVDQQIDQVSQEIRLISPADDDLNYIVGLYASEYELKDRVRRDFDFCTYPAVLGFPIAPSLSPVDFGSPCFDPTGTIVSLSTASALMGMPEVEGVPALTVSGLSREVRGENYAVFGQGEVALTETVQLLAGLRYQYDRTQLDFAVDIPNPLPGLGFGAVPVAPDVDAVTGSALSGKLSLQKQLGDDAMAYVSYARGYKGPTGEIRASALAGGMAMGDVLEEIAAETSDNFELGIKGSFAAGRGFWAATAFHSDYADYQAEQFSGADQTFVLANVGEVRTQGLELDAQWQPDMYWSFNGALTYLNAEIQEYEGARCFAPEVEDPDCTASAPYSKNLSGGDLPVAPDLKAYLNGRYQRVLTGTNLMAFAQLSYSWQDDVQFSLDQNPRTVQEAYGLWNASLGFGTEDGRYLVSLFAKNLTGENYVTSMFQDFITGSSANIVQYRPQEADRLLGVSLRAQF